MHLSTSPAPLDAQDCPGGAAGAGAIQELARQQLHIPVDTSHPHAIVPDGADGACTPAQRKHGGVQVGGGKGANPLSQQCKHAQEMHTGGEGGRGV